MLKLSFVGDISLGEHYFSFGHGPKTFSLKNYVFSNVEEKFKLADCVIANLEGPISESKIESNDPEDHVFKGSSDIILQLKKSGINVLNIANNHILQHGPLVFSETIQLLTKNDIQIIGINRQEPLVLSCGEKEIALFGCSDVPDNKYQNQNYYQTFDDNFIAAIKRAVNKYQTVVICIHWGREDTHEPTNRQLELEKIMRDIGIKIIVGHHPHIFYSIKNEPNFFCAYSLGDFIFDLPWDKKLLKTAVLNMLFTGKADLERSSLTPIYMTKKGCLPKITGDDVLLESNLFSLYKHTSAVKYLEAKKLYYYFSNIFRGNTHLKFNFIKNKLAKKITSK